MNWINDVKDEIKHLDVSFSNLRKFGLLIGGIFFAIAILLWRKHNNNLYLFGSFGIILTMLAFIAPNTLKFFYKIWMGMAFAIGWIVSRILLCIIFFLVIFPIGYISRLFGKNFLDVNFKKRSSSYWIIKEKKVRENYETMY